MAETKPLKGVTPFADFVPVEDAVIERIQRKVDFDIDKEGMAELKQICQLFIANNKIHSPDRRLVDDLAEAAGKYPLREIYCPENPGLYPTLVKKFWEVQGVFVRPAPHEADIDFGVSLVIEALEDESLEIPQGTVLRGQLGQMTSDNLGYTIHPLRYLLGAFSLFHPRRALSAQVERRHFYYG
jgi:hypothetical protein